MYIQNVQEKSPEKPKKPSFKEWITQVDSKKEDIYETAVSYLRGMSFNQRIEASKMAKKRGDGLGNEIYRLVQTWTRATTKNRFVVERSNFAKEILRQGVQK